MRCACAGIQHTRMAVKHAELLTSEKFAAVSSFFPELYIYSMWWTELKKSMQTTQLCTWRMKDVKEVWIGPWCKQNTHHSSLGGAEGAGGASLWLCFWVSQCVPPPPVAATRAPLHTRHHVTSLALVAGVSELFSVQLLQVMAWKPQHHPLN